MICKYSSKMAEDGIVYVIRPKGGGERRVKTLLNSRHLLVMTDRADIVAQVLLQT